MKSPSVTYGELYRVGWCCCCCLKSEEKNARSQEPGAITQRSAMAERANSGATASGTKSLLSGFPAVLSWAMVFLCAISSLQNGGDNSTSLTGALSENILKHIEQSLSVENAIKGCIEKSVSISNVKEPLHVSSLLELMTAYLKN